MNRRCHRCGKQSPLAFRQRNRTSRFVHVVLFDLLLSSSTLVPPGYGKPQTRARNLRRRLKRQHERDGTDVSGPVSGANAVEPDEEMQADAPAVPALMSLSLRNKNKAKNFKSLMGKPLPPKIIFGDEAQITQLIPPSSRSSVPANVIVTSVDVEADSRRDKKKRQMADKYDEELAADVTLDYGDPEEDIESIESKANKQWATLAELTRDTVVRGMLVGYKVRHCRVCGSSLTSRRPWASTLSRTRQDT